MKDLAISRALASQVESYSLERITDREGLKRIRPAWDVLLRRDPEAGLFLSYAWLAPALLLGVAYSASVGGLGTPIGTPPNLVFMQVYQETTGTSISFTQWMLWALPVVIIMLPLMGLWLTRGETEIHGSNPAQ